MSLVLSGNEANDPQELADAEVNHLRRLLAWISLEYSLGEEMMVGFLEGAQKAVECDPAVMERAQQIVDQRIARVQHVPKYIRQAVKMLQKSVRDHDQKTRVMAKDGGQ